MDLAASLAFGFGLGRSGGAPERLLALGPVLATAPFARGPAAVAGAAYLGWSGACLLRAARPRRGRHAHGRPGRRGRATVPALAPPTWRSSVASALAVTWLNPVALVDSGLVFGGALAALDGDGPAGLLAGLALAPVCWAGGLLLAVRATSRWTVRSHPGALEGVAGVAMVLFGVRLLGTGSGVW